MKKKDFSDLILILFISRIIGSILAKVWSFKKFHTRKTRVTMLFL